MMEGFYKDMISIERMRKAWFTRLLYFVYVNE